MRLLQAKFSMTVKFQEYNDHQTFEETWVADEGEIVDEKTAVPAIIQSVFRGADYAATLRKQRVVGIVYTPSVPKKEEPAK